VLLEGAREKILLSPLLRVGRETLKGREIRVRESLRPVTTLSDGNGI